MLELVHSKLTFQSLVDVGELNHIFLKLFGAPLARFLFLSFWVCSNQYDGFCSTC